MQTALESLFGPGVGWENSFEAPELYRFYFMLQPSSINVFLKHLAVKPLGGKPENDETKPFNGIFKSL